TCLTLGSDRSSRADPGRRACRRGRAGGSGHGRRAEFRAESAKAEPDPVGAEGLAGFGSGLPGAAEIVDDAGAQTLRKRYPDVPVVSTAQPTWKEEIREHIGALPVPAALQAPGWGKKDTRA